eukprot:TRINITY_DN5657_c0_g1_i2.p1 TRINITY_DN5657_c0_g1~~TRINITY_DN5657_c0_g1_i2.p1  ORF type:complete len:346 (-),score=-35.20 TRINITY_DN5657_c0_g1_i2:38-1075(-)
MSFLEKLRSRFDSRFGAVDTTSAAAEASPDTDFENPYGDPSAATPEAKASVVPAGDRANNFPPCRPCIHHAIAVDIPREHRPVMRRCYIHWYFHSFCYVWNLIALCGALAIRESGALGGFFGALIWLLLAPFISFFVYLAFYTGVRTESPFYYYIWFAAFGCLTVSNFWNFLGFESYGSAGFASMIKAFQDGSVAIGLLMFFATTLWACDTLMGLYLLIMGYRTYGAVRRTSGSGTTDATRSFNETSAPSAIVVEPSFSVNGDAPSPAPKSNWGANFDAMKSALGTKISENKEAISGFVTKVVRENKDTVAKVAVDNRDVIAKGVVQHSEAIYTNKAALDSVFNS